MPQNVHITRKITKILNHTSEAADQITHKAKIKETYICSITVAQTIVYSAAKHSCIHFGIKLTANTY